MFISYDHDDRPVAYGIQRGLHRIGRPMGRSYALRVFRDSTDLTASPDLWGKVTEAMDRSRYMIVVLSPHAVISKWVNREVAYWLERCGSDRLLFVVAGGSLTWDDAAKRFDPDCSDAALTLLTQPGVLAAEPLYVDVSEDAPWDPDAALFREKVTDLAAPIHGKPKYELGSEDLREHRRFRRLRRAAIAGLVLLTVLAVVAAGVAVDRQREAQRQRNEAVALALAASSRDAAHSNPALALALAAESALATPVSTWQATSALVSARVAMSESGAQQILEPLDTALRRANQLIFSADGRLLVNTVDDGTLQLWDPTTSSSNR